ncbi:MAG TPA: leucine--tRNA ligase, partial [Candidatus Paceibacterota bacterium]|nr:leucine--tRNA ligase [Candidatus Paceibacterota bacterium]
MKPTKYDPKKIEKKWQKEWKKKKVFEAKETSGLPKKFVMIEFPYPSGAGLHMGHMRPFVAGDVVSKYWKLQGKNTMYPIGWDAFGLPAENYAIKNKVHPSVSTKKNISNAKRQLEAWGTGFDWSREIDTTDPAYYKWTQKIFLEFFKAGLAYEKEGEINWCPKDKTGLANEEVIDGKCERCGTEVEKKNLRQWYLKITDYAQKLLDGLQDLPEWPEHVKLQQENWIGRSEGAEIAFKIKDKKFETENEVTVFTTRADTLFGATYLVLAPEHPLVDSYAQSQEEVKTYIENCKKKSEEERTNDKKEKTGVEIKGLKAINPASGEEIPVWIADYVLGNYGTGAIMAVPAHDDRDLQFARKFNLPIKPVVVRTHILEETQTPGLTDVLIKSCIESGFAILGDGLLINSKQFDGYSTDNARKEIIKYVGGKIVTKYKLRDWVFSRQRYWGEPIPLIHCKRHGVVAVPDKDLPVKLPSVKNYEPTGTGESPLAAIESWVKTPCPQCLEESKKTKYLVFDFDGVL